MKNMLQGLAPDLEPGAGVVTPCQAGDAPDAPDVPGGALPPGDFDAFVAEATRRKATVAARGEEGRPRFWFDADPLAGANLPKGFDPVSRALARRKQGKSHDHFAMRVRFVCERLAAVPSRSMTMQDVMRYPWHHIDVPQAESLVNWVNGHYGTQPSKNDAICAVRAVLAQCHRAGLISAARRDLLFETLATKAPGRSRRRRRLAKNELVDLIKACLSSKSLPKGARDAAIVALLMTTGMRGCELVRLYLADWDREDNTIVLRDTKNGRDHIVFVTAWARPYLDRWLRYRGFAPGALFTAMNRDDMTPLVVETVRYAIQRHGSRAGMRPFGLHDFRRTFATALLRTHDASLVSDLLNHQKLDSTLIYDLVNDDEMRAAAASINLPNLLDERDRHAGGRATGADNIQGRA